MKTTLLCLGTLKERYWKDAEREYQKRLSRFGGYTVVELPEISLPDHPSESEIRQALEREGDAILRRILPQSCAIALCVEGASLSSEQLASYIENVPQSGKSALTFIIGSSYGLSPKVKQACALQLSFSAMTFPHQLMRILLAEQLYRSCKIGAHEPYHK